ncbi:hypothetical protein [Pseudomonas zhanjiangensis]|uniref:Uncharacterized protein n=1 Tax=Pseudomonas zhanjiangensis TaxID=3239015 RepID=A0ABV3YY58_9PSED
MKPHLRLFLLLLLSFALPLNGMASMGAFVEPCPMEQQDLAMADMEHACCDQQMEQPAAGKTCKSGQECKTGCTLQVCVIKSSIEPSAQTVPSYSLDFVPVPTPFGVWRPPRA